MYLLYCDETNIDWKENDFLVYGGLAIKGPRSLELSKKIDEIRDLANIESNFLLKFKPSPKNLNHNEELDKQYKLDYPPFRKKEIQL